MFQLPWWVIQLELTKKSILACWAFKVTVKFGEPFNFLTF
jgi:hypothetical protein